MDSTRKPLANSFNFRLKTHHSTLVHTINLPMKLRPMCTLLLLLLYQYNNYYSTTTMTTLLLPPLLPLLLLLLQSQTTALHWGVWWWCAATRHTWGWAVDWWWNQRPYSTKWYDHLSSESPSYIHHHMATFDYLIQLDYKLLLLLLLLLLLNDCN